MADSPSNNLKRPHPPDDVQNVQKKIRSTNGSPAPQSNGTKPGKPDVSALVAAAKERAAAIAARMKQPSSHSGADSIARAKLNASPSLAGSGNSDGMSRAEQLRARVAAALGAKSDQRPSPLYPPTMDDGMPQRDRGGLGIGLHPSLLESNQGPSKSKQAIQPTSSTSKTNLRPEATKKKQLDLSAPDLSEIRKGPYFDSSIGAISATNKARNRRELAFNQKGKYVQQAALLRRQQALESLKQRVAANARKAGLDEDISEKRWKKEEPPDVEWFNEELDKANIDTEDSIITAFIQHPVLIEPPSVKNMAPPKPLPLTKQEMAKKRRMLRMANLKEEQAKQRLGLIETPEVSVLRTLRPKMSREYPQALKNST